MPRPYLPVGLAVIDHGQDAQNLNAAHAASVDGTQSDFDDINGVIIADEARVRILDRWVFPGPREAAVAMRWRTCERR